jgi:hypothetical protein
MKIILFLVLLTFIENLFFVFFSYYGSIIVKNLKKHAIFYFTYSIFQFIMYGIQIKNICELFSNYHLVHDITIISYICNYIIIIIYSVYFRCIYKEFKKIKNYTLLPN